MFVAGATDAYGAPAWCSDDPIISIHANSVHVTVGFSGSNLASVSGPVEYVAVVRQSDAGGTTIDTSVATLPTTASKYVLDDATFTSYFGPQTDVVIAVRVNAKKNFDTVSTFTSALGATSKLVSANGKSNSWLLVSYDFQP